MTGLSLLILAALQIWDIILTTRILRAGGRELNGIMAWIMAVAGNGWLAAKYAVGMGAGIWAASAGAVWLIWLIIAVMAWVIHHNLGEWHEAKRRGRR